MDKKAEFQAFSEWSFKKEGEAIGRMDGSDAAWAGWEARALLATPAPLSDEPVAFDKALKETYGMVDAFNPPPAGTYYRGQHDGIIAALKTIADNFKRHAAPTPSDKQEPFAWMRPDVLDRLKSTIAYSAGTELLKNRKDGYVPIYATPPATPSDKQEADELKQRYQEGHHDGYSEGLEAGRREYSASISATMKELTERIAELERDIHYSQKLR
ncbi:MULTISPECIES: hypothetical protein [unclassified Caballeronia]|uniref:hypothetical protein n=1 Tax=unclassified Caballeronia TaxID=2646786 RepID=UPI002027901B|nr:MULTISPECIES: hypothetical protein [unclassified Caballeronia]